MITKVFKTTKGKLQVSIPAQITEITLGQLIAMQDAENMTDLDAIHILSGTPLDELKSIKNFADLQQFSTHITELSQSISKIYDSDSLPKNITLEVHGDKKNVAVLSNLSVEPAGAFLAARDVITDEINKHIQQHGEDNWKDTFNPSLGACGLVLAHYFYCPATGNPYNEYAAEQFLTEIKKLPFTDVLPVATHWLNAEKRSGSYF